MANLRFRVLPRFPARLFADGGLSVVKDGADWTISPNWGLLSVLSAVTDPANTDIWVRVTSAGVSTFFRMTLQNFLASVASTGAGYAFVWNFSTDTTDADPGAGIIRFNQAVQNTATQFFTDLLDSAGNDLTVLLDSLDDSTNTVKGNWSLVKVGDQTKRLAGTLSAVTAPAGYRKLTIAVTVSTSASPFANGEALLFTFARSGDAGAAGTGVDVVETDVASAATTDIGAAATHRVRITGTTTITSFGTSASKLRFVRFAGALTLTHNATSLILPGGVNFTTAANDTAGFASDASGNWTCQWYKRADGQNVVTATTAQFLANTPDKALATDEVWAAGALFALTDAATIAVDMSLGLHFTVTLGASRTLGNPTNTKVGQTGLLIITQDATGSRLLTLSSSWEQAGGGTNLPLSTAPTSKDVYSYFVQTSTSILLFPGGKTFA